MKFSQIERGSTIFLLLPGGDQKFNRVFHPVSTTPPPPRELKNDNSLSSSEGSRNTPKFRQISGSILGRKESDNIPV